MPLVPDGPMRIFYERLHELHRSAGQPSMRDMQRRTRQSNPPNGINPTTIHDALSSPRLARREIVRAVVGVLGGQVDEFDQLWRAARDFQSGILDGVGTPEPSAPPHQLPPDVFAFTGRAAPLSILDHLATNVGDVPTAVVISAVSGTAGVGKTALAVHWAHSVADRFPDGQLYVDLRGFGPDEPMPAHQAIAGFLRSLGVASVDIPYEMDERTAHYRSLVSGRRMLVVLDNAVSADQVRPLLPGSAGCLVLVTSRDSLAGLVARDGARRIGLDLLDSHEAVQLLGALIGRRAEVEPAAVEALARLCTRLPLALRIAAELAAARPSASLAELVDELADERTRLELLDAGDDPRTDVRSVFSWSYRGLAPQVARTFRLLGLNPARYFDACTSAALADADVTQVKAALGALARLHLVEPSGAGRYSMHDLLRVYAAHLAERDETADGRRAALHRLLDYYVTTAARAMDLAFPAEAQRRPRAAGTTTAAPGLETPAAARAWLDDQRGALVAAVSFATQNGRPDHAVKIADILWRYLHNGAHHQEAMLMHTAAVQASGQLGDRRYDGIAQVNLGTVHWRLGRYDQAVTSYALALKAFREVGDRAGEARAYANLGAIYWLWGRPEEAAEHSRLALIAFGDVGDSAGEARALSNLGAIRTGQGRYSEAADNHRRALDIAREVGDGPCEARALDNLGVVLARQGRLDTAAEHHRQALAIMRELGDRTGEAEVLENLGNLDREHGHHDEALERYHLALDIASRIGNRNREASVLNAFGETFRTAGRPQQARPYHETSLVKAAEIGNRFEQARAHNGIGHALYADGDVNGARSHWRDALTIYTDIGVPEARDLSDRLAALDQADPAVLP